MPRNRRQGSENLGLSLRKIRDPGSRAMSSLIALRISGFRIFGHPMQAQIHTLQTELARAKEEEHKEAWPPQ